MKFYFKKRNETEYNLYVSEFHYCLRTGIKDDTEEIEEAIKYYLEKYGMDKVKRRLIEIDGENPNFLVSPVEKERLEEYFQQGDLPFQDLIDEITKKYEEEN